jgi:DNA-binding response OmpR family regulator
MTSAREPGPYRPCLVLAHADAGYAADACRRFRRLGWDVYQAHAGAEVRRLAHLLEPDLVVLDANLVGESGWLTCAKLMRERPAGRVVLVDEGGQGSQDMAAFVGATAVVSRQDGLAALLQASWPRPASAAG